MSHLKPFSPAMACERQPLSKLPLEARTMIEAYCQLPPKTPTAELIDAKMQEHWDIVGRMVPVHNPAFLEMVLAHLVLWKPRARAMLCCVSEHGGFAKYLRNNFDRSPGSVWTTRYTHRKLGHVLFCNFIGGSWSCCAGMNSIGNSIKYPGWV